MPITSVDQFKSKLYQEIQISGFNPGELFTIKVKPVSIFSLMANNTLPNPLLQTAVSLFERTKKQGNGPEPKVDYSKMGEFMIFMCKQVMVEPSYEEVGEYLTDEQLNEIFVWTQGGVALLESFRKESANN